MFRNEIVQGSIFYFGLQSRSDENNAGFCFTSINIIADKFQYQSNSLHYAQRENSSYSSKNETGGTKIGIF